MQIDIDEEKANAPLTKREKIAIYVLLTLFNFIAPAKYSHQVKAFIEEINKML